jgi:hypothetical protein
VAPLGDTVRLERIGRHEIFICAKNVNIPHQRRVCSIHHVRMLGWVISKSSPCTTSLG